MRRTFPLLALLSLLGVSGALPAETPAHFRGKLDPVPVADDSTFKPLPIQPASATAAPLTGPPAEGDRVFHGKLQLNPLDRKMDRDLFLVAPAQGEPYLLVDLDRDGKLAGGERFPFEPVAGGSAQKSVALRVPASAGPYPFFPVRLVLPPADDPGRPMLLASRNAWVEGTVDLGSRKLRVRYALSSTGSTLDPRLGPQGMDVDGDGEFAVGLGSPESDMALDERLVFRVGDLYLSTESLDPARGEVVLRAHPAAEYVRFELSPGSRVPDFAFTDLEGKSRRLSEMRGKVVLLDFWGTWCLPCLQELPHLREVYQAYKDRGFEILGMDYNDHPARLKAFVAREKLPWPNATPESVEELIEQRFRIQSFPAGVLLDREGRVVAVNLRGADLKKKLAELFPAASPAR